jgi:hypothetical protein
MFRLPHRFDRGPWDKFCRPDAVRPESTNGRMCRFECVEPVEQDNKLFIIDSDPCERRNAAIVLVILAIDFLFQVPAGIRSLMATV